MVTYNDNLLVTDLIHSEVCAAETQDELDGTDESIPFDDDYSPLETLEDPQFFQMWLAGRMGTLKLAQGREMDEVRLTEEALEEWKEKIDSFLDPERERALDFQCDDLASITARFAE